MNPLPQNAGSRLAGECAEMKALQLAMPWLKWAVRKVGLCSGLLDLGRHKLQVLLQSVAAEGEGRSSLIRFLLT